MAKVIRLTTPKVIPERQNEIIAPVGLIIEPGQILMRVARLTEATENLNRQGVYTIKLTGAEAGQILMNLTSVTQLRNRMISFLESRETGTAETIDKPIQNRREVVEAAAEGEQIGD